MLRFLDGANAVTLAGLVAAVGAAFLAVAGRPELAMAALVGAGLCDLFDGPLARRLPRSDEGRRFGGELDSLVDACAFGFAPAILLYSAGLTATAEVALLALFVACAVWRLAYFNAITLSGGGRPMVGLPTAYVAWILPAVGLTGYLGFAGFRIAVVSTLVLVSLAMVSTLRFPKPRGAGYVALVAAGLALAGAYLGLGRPFPVR